MERRAEGGNTKKENRFLRDVENGIQFAYFLTALLQLLAVTKDNTEEMQK